jgi:hypothetical protein
MTTNLLWHRRLPSDVGLWAFACRAKKSLLGSNEHRQSFTQRFFLMTCTPNFV